MKKRFKTVKGFNIEKIGRETLGAGTGIYQLSGLQEQALIDFYTKDQSGRRSFIDLLAKGLTIEQFQEVKIDPEFMNDLDFKLKEANSELTAEEFMNEVERDYDGRTREFASLDKTESLKKKTKPTKKETKKPLIKKEIAKEKAKEKAKLNQNRLNKIINNVKNLLGEKRGKEGKRLTITTMLNKIAETIGNIPFVNLSRKQQLKDLTNFLTKELSSVFNLAQFATASNLASAGNKITTAKDYNQLYMKAIKGLESLYAKGIDENIINDTIQALKDGEFGTIENLLKKAKKSILADNDIEIALKKNKDIAKQIDYIKDNLKALERGRETILDGLRKLLRKDVKKNLGPLRFLLQSGSNNFNWWRNLATYKGFITGAKGNAEHVFQAGAASDISLIMMAAPDNIWNGYKEWFLKNYYQVETGGGKGNKKFLSQAEEQYAEKSINQYTGDNIGESWWAKSETFPFLKQKLIEYAQGKIEASQIPDSIIRYFNEYFNADANTMFILNEKGEIVSVA